MSQLRLLPDELQRKSKSKEEIILDYFDSLIVLELLKEKNYAVLGFEMLYEGEQLTELKNYVCYFPDNLVWDEFITEAYHQVKDNLSKEYLQLRYDDLNEDNIFFSLTFVSREEFESFYFDYIKI